MKKLIVLSLTLILFTACENSSRYSQSSPEIDTIKAAIADYENGNWESFRKVYSDTAKSFHNSKDVSTAPDKTVELMKKSVSNLSSYGFMKDEGDLEMVVDDQGRTWVNFWGTWEATLAANNAKLVTPVHVTFQMVDNKVVREYGYWDNAPRMKAEMEAEAARESKSAVMTRDSEKTKDATMKKDPPKKKATNTDDALKN